MAERASDLTHRFEEGETEASPQAARQSNFNHAVLQSVAEHYRFLLASTIKKPAR
jgi:hypothetical protein|tara:strand:+ start:743 stop:907 length:165 start_codon:yes stop_codon:yes gene_type:complete